MRMTNMMTDCIMCTYNCKYIHIDLSGTISIYIIYRFPVVARPNRPNYPTGSSSFSFSFSMSVKLDLQSTQMAARLLRYQYTYSGGLTLILKDPTFYFRPLDPTLGAVLRSIFSTVSQSVTPSESHETRLAEASNGRA